MTALPLALALLVSPVAPPPAPVAADSAVRSSTDSASGVAATTPARGVPPLSPLRLVEGFEPPAAAYAAGHRGADLAGTPGQQVVAALPGTVTTAGRIAGVPVVVVSHGDVRTTYQPVVADVAVGQQVAGGQALGTLVVDGGHCVPAACLHWGLKRDDDYLDPMSLLGPRPVRLLPLD